MIRGIKQESKKKPLYIAHKIGKFAEFLEIKAIIIHICNTIHIPMKEAGCF